jgi:hypothetical protein
VQLHPSMGITNMVDLPDQDPSFQNQFSNPHSRQISMGDILPNTQNQNFGNMIYSNQLTLIDELNVEQEYNEANPH